MMLYRAWLGFPVTTTCAVKMGFSSERHQRWKSWISSTKSSYTEQRLGFEGAEWVRTYSVDGIVDLDSVGSFGGRLHKEAHAVAEDRNRGQHHQNREKVGANGVSNGPVGFHVNDHSGHDDAQALDHVADHVHDGGANVEVLTFVGDRGDINDLGRVVFASISVLLLTRLNGDFLLITASDSRALHTVFILVASGELALGLSTVEKFRGCLGLLGRSSILVVGIEVAELATLVGVAQGAAPLRFRPLRLDR